MKKGALAAGFVCCALGFAILALWFAAYWPGTSWTLVSRAQLIAKGRQTARQFGLNVSAWEAYPVASVSKSLSHVGHGVSPLTLRITYAAGHGGPAAEVGFDSDGSLNYWRAPADFKSDQHFASPAEAAKAAFELMAGDRAARYRPASRSAGDEEDEEEYEFKRRPIANSPTREVITVSAKKAAVQRVRRKVTLEGSEEDDDDQGYWNVISPLYALIYVLVALTAASIFVLWLVRRALSVQFPVRMAVAGFVLMLGTALLGSNWDNIHSVHLDSNTPGLTQIFGALGVLLFVAAGRGISAKWRPKWISLEQLCLLAPLGQSTGQAIAAGLLFSPLLAAIPFLVTGCGLFPGSWVLPDSAALLYSRSPLMDSFAGVDGIKLLMLFGFGIPAMERLVRFRWLGWIIVIPAGIVLFAKVVSGPLSAPLTAGCLILAVYWFVWLHFDLLAILTLNAGANLVLAVPVLMQKHQAAWALIVALCGLVVLALSFYLRGRKVAEGDPLATNPMVTGFRAEREKLMAEFSLARRAQQDMLPQAPPKISGYSLAASCTPSLEVGGDLYDFLKLQDGRIGIGVADVSGKGVPAALYMTLTKGLLSAVTRNTSDLGRVMEDVNRHLHGVTRKKVFVTMALGFLDAERRILQCVRAGHNPMVWRQKEKNSTVLVSPTGLGLGITTGKIFGAQLQVEEMPLSEGDAVVFYSDGITEAMNRDLEQFGEQRLMEAVDRTDALDATAARDSILSEVREFLGGVHPQDDMTIVVLRVGASQVQPAMRG